jgi:hypothetical protein
MTLTTKIYYSRHYLLNILYLTCINVSDNISGETGHEEAPLGRQF